MALISSGKPLNSPTFKLKPRKMIIWEDSEIRFDVPFVQMKMRSGEKVIDRLDSVEDTKGNGGDRGRLIVTNLRIMWHSLSSPRSAGLISETSEEHIFKRLLQLCPQKFQADAKIYFSAIGLNCILSATTRSVISKLRGAVEALYILTKSANSRYEFIFTNLIPGNTRLFTSVMGVHKAYSTTRIYRELKLRGAIVKNKQLRLLPLEHIVASEGGVWNLSSDQGNLGSFIITNVRVVWFADMNEHFNISLPYLQIAQVKIRESKFGVALVIESAEASGGYVLGFRIDPVERLQNIHREISSLQAVYSKTPIFGVEYSIGDQPLLPEEPPTISPREDGIDDSIDDLSHTVSSYLTETQADGNYSPVYCPELGLAVEELKPGYTIQALWEVLPSK